MNYIFHAIDHRLQMENLSIFRENFFDSRIFRFSFKRSYIFHAIGHRSSNREFINFQKIPFQFIFRFSFNYFSHDRSSIIKKRIYHFLKKTFSIHGSKRVIFFTRSIIDHQIQNLSLFKENLFDPRILRFSFKRVIFFTRSIIDHHGELEEFINFQKKLFRSTNSSLFLSIFPMQIAMQFEFDGWSITDSKRRIYKFVNFQFD